MRKWIASLSSVLPESLVGRKAAALSRLVEKGFPVPAGVCISTDAYNTAAATWPTELHLPDGLLEELTSAFPTNIPLAVRSSAVLEDMPDTSLAGLYTSFLNVKGLAGLERAVLDCWKSYTFAPTNIKKGGISILVQPMLDADCAGVCFTVDPVFLRPDFLLVVSAWGLGAGVAAGSVPTDTARLCRNDLGIKDFSIADKHTAIRLAPSGIGVAPVSVPDELVAAPCLPEGWLQRVGQFGLAIEQVFGVPQDVEWAIAGGQLWILQSRPITALPVETREAVQYPIIWENEDEPHHYWWLERARDSSGAPLLPAELDFVRIITRGGHDSVYYGGGANTRWRKYVNGRVYMAAAKSSNSPGHVRVYGAALRDMYERLMEQDVTIWEHWGPEIVQATNRLAAFDASKADGSSLAGHLEDAVATAMRHWMLHTLSPRPIRFKALLYAYSRMTGLLPEEFAVEIPFLLAGIDTIQTRLIEALYDLACLALGSPETAKAYALGNEVDANKDSLKLEPFARGFHNLITEYGDRLCYQQVPGYPVELPMPWREVPEHVWKMVAAYLPLAAQGGQANQASLSLRDVRIETMRAVNQHIESLCDAAIASGTGSTLVEEFRRTLGYVRRNAAFLDEANHYIDQISEGQYIQALLYAGRWLAARGCLLSQFDIFWLNIDEVLAALRKPSTGLEEVLNERRVQFAEWQALIPPACLGVPDPGLPARSVISPRSMTHNEERADLPAKTLTGEPASRGRAAGRARLINGDTPPADIAPGDVLVAPNASLLVIPFLPAMAAVVLDHGSPGDHFAITAREFGLPAVCATLHATYNIPEGAWVTVDANTGLVTWE